ncbi:ABC transporter ATP-binding protein [Geomonas sp. Red875]|uniref:ABC transporter ATP-binding protein n=1 Tax=Geomesophilobacter sediminis TaxID=2798584 RepID=A0A8J7J3D7_9BACT|nr:ABC transporter ATP-binding protein [Geomesophilobacter sediminis]
MSELGYRYPGTADPALSGISFSVARGECVCITGNSGCGKSTLLMLIKDVLHGGTRSGSIEVSAVSRHFSDLAVAILFQDPESQIVCSTVAEEVAFGPENLCVSPGEIGARIEDALAAVGLAGYASRSVDRLSAGEKQRLALASVLSLNPSLLLLDEPTSQLDAHQKAEFCRLLDRLKRFGYTIILAEHDLAPLAQVVDRYLVLDRGRLVEEAIQAPAGSLSPVPDRARRAVGNAAGPTAVSISGLRLRYPEVGEVLKGIDLQIRQGERIHLIGRNGAGKSTLLRCLSGLERSGSGKLELHGVGAPRPEKLAGKVGVLFQNPVRQLFCETVAEEVSFTLRRMGLSSPEIRQLTARVLDDCNIAHLAERAPLTLSFGEQHRVALAAALAPRPYLLLLDEPFSGLDLPQRTALLETLRLLSEQSGTTVLIASHDELPDRAWPDRKLTLERGILHELAP